MSAWLLGNALVAGVAALGAAVLCRRLAGRPALCHFLWLLVFVLLVAPPLPVASAPGAWLRAGAAEELSISLAPPTLPALVGEGLWTTPGAPAEVALPVPLQGGLVGQTVYAQGVLVDPVAAGGVGIALADGVALTIGS